MRTHGLVYDQFNMKQKSLVAKPVTNADTDSVDTRQCVLSAALHLFRKRGYHAAGLNDILELARAPKGSLHHHFPDGKEEIAVAVVAQITQGIIGLFAVNCARSTSAMLASEEYAALAKKYGLSPLELSLAFVVNK